MKRLEDCRLYAFVDTAYLHGRTPDAVARQLCAGGADIIQLRAKHSPVEELRQMAEAILPVTRDAGVPLVINDHLSIAREVSAEFCHLGQEDFFDAGHVKISELQNPESKSRHWIKHARAGPGATGNRGGRGLHRHRTGICHRHETRSETRDTGLCPLGCS